MNKKEVVDEIRREKYARGFEYFVVFMNDAMAKRFKTGTVRPRDWRNKTFTEKDRAEELVYRLVRLFLYNYMKKQGALTTSDALEKLYSDMVNYLVPFTLNQLDAQLRTNQKAVQFATKVWHDRISVMVKKTLESEKKRAVVEKFVDPKARGIRGEGKRWLNNTLIEGDVDMADLPYRSTEDIMCELDEVNDKIRQMESVDVFYEARKRYRENNREEVRKAWSRWNKEHGAKYRPSRIAFAVAQQIKK